MNSLIIFITYTVLCGILYWMGGQGKPFRSIFRDAGCPITMIAYMTLLGKWHFSLVFCAILMYAALTTYWKILNKIFKKPTTDCYWFNWLAHGFMVGLAMLPYIYVTHNAQAIVLRALIMGLAMMVWSSIIIPSIKKLSGFPDEFGRGTTIILTLPII